MASEDSPHLSLIRSEVNLVEQPETGLSVEVMPGELLQRMVEHGIPIPAAALRYPGGINPVPIQQPEVVSWRDHEARLRQILDWPDEDFAFLQSHLFPDGLVRIQNLIYFELLRMAQLEWRWQTAERYGEINNGKPLRRLQEVAALEGQLQVAIPDIPITSETLPGHIQAFFRLLLTTTNAIEYMRDAGSIPANAFAHLPGISEEGSRYIREVLKGSGVISPWYCLSRGHDPYLSRDHRVDDPAYKLDFSRLHASWKSLLEQGQRHPYGMMPPEEARALDRSWEDRAKERPLLVSPTWDILRRLFNFQGARAGHAQIHMLSTWRQYHLQDGLEVAKSPAPDITPELEAQILEILRSYQREAGDAIQVVGEHGEYSDLLRQLENYAKAIAARTAGEGDFNAAFEKLLQGKLGPAERDMFELLWRMVDMLSTMRSRGFYWADYGDLKTAAGHFNDQIFGFVERLRREGALTDGDPARIQSMLQKRLMHIVQDTTSIFRRR